jgi:hypothetical protein
MYPRMALVRQKFAAGHIADIAAAVREEVARVLPATAIEPGDSVAVTVGSRGIANLALIVRTLVAELRRAGAEVYLVPAMGSHGGATAEGQRQVLEHYGVTAGAMGAPIKSAMEVAEIGLTQDGVSVFVDKNALAADHIVVFNRVKPHTDFRGGIESGLLKIMAIGLGKHRGAQHYHQAAVSLGGERVIRTVGAAVLARCPVAFGLAVVENAYDQTAVVAALPPAAIESEEAALLRTAKDLMPRLPFPQADILIVDRIGKNISGTGMDTNIVGRIMNIYTPEPAWPKITRIIVRDLTAETAGNAVGIGMADFTTRTLAAKIDTHATYTNCITGLVVEKARLPIVCENDREAVAMALRTIGAMTPREAKVIWIRDTLSLGEVRVSEALLAAAGPRDDLEAIGQPEPLAFDAAGTLAGAW